MGALSAPPPLSFTGMAGRDSWTVPRGCPVRSVSLYGITLAACAVILLSAGEVDAVASSQSLDYPHEPAPEMHPDELIEWSDMDFLRPISQPPQGHHPAMNAVPEPVPEVIQEAPPPMRTALMAAPQQTMSFAPR